MGAQIMQHLVLRDLHVFACGLPGTWPDGYRRLLADETSLGQAGCLRIEHDPMGTSVRHRATSVGCGEEATVPR